MIIQDRLIIGSCPGLTYLIALGDVDSAARVVVQLPMQPLNGLEAQSVRTEVQLFAAPVAGHRPRGYCIHTNCHCWS